MSADLRPPCAIFLGLVPPFSSILFGILKVLMGKRELLAGRSPLWSVTGWAHGEMGREGSTSQVG